MPADETVQQIEEALLSLLRGPAVARLHERVAARVDGPADRGAWMALGRIAGGPLRLSDLARCTPFDLSTISRKVQQLVEAGLVEREPDADDRRAATLTLTPAGRRFLRSLRAARTAVLAEALAGWSDEDLERLGALLERLADALVPEPAAERRR